MIGRRERAAWGFVAPALIAIAIFFVVPVVASLLLSLTDFDIYALADLGNMRFVGLQNYERLLSNPLFWQAMKNTVWFSVLGVPLSIIASLTAAVILNARTIKWRPVWRVMFFAPYVTTLVATAVLWNYLLHSRYGVINWVLTSAGLPAVDWLGDPNTSIPAILIFVVWKIFGYNMLIFLAVLQTVPDDLYEAARIDGAGPWARFTNVTLPAIAPTLLLVSIISVAGFFQLFAEPYVMTQGGPAQSTVTVLYFMYEEGFKWWNLGSASAVAFVLFLCIFAVTMVQLAVSRRVGGGAHVKLRTLLLNICVALIGLIVLFPLLWMLSVSFMATGEAAVFPPPLLPSAPTLEHYRDLFVNQGMGRYMWNSFALATLATGLALLFTVPAGYAFAKLSFKGRERLFQLLIGALVIPAQIGTLPLFLMLKSVGLVNTYAGALVPWLASIFGLFLVRQYALSIPDEMLEAARVDGASEGQIFRRIVLPTLTPILVTLGLFVFLGSWNDFLWPLIILTDQSNYTLPVALAALSREHVQDVELMMAGAVITVAPVLILFLALQRFYIRGMLAGSVKG